GGPAPDFSVGYGIVDPVAALTADLTEIANLPDPHATTHLAAPAPRRTDRGPLIAVAAVSALGAAVVAVVFVLTAQRKRQ
ncbi:MAG: type VII secretion-associated serine protease mycosin, partial [Gordonia sp. (in: high G+C Gram-positive bacteria)]